MGSVTVLRILIVLWVSSFLACNAADILLGGVFPEHFNEVVVHNKDKLSPCGKRNQRTTVDRAAMDYVVQEVNNSDSILPGISLAVDVKDSCNDLDHAIQNTLHYTFVKKRFLDNTSQCRADRNCCMDDNKDTPVVAIIAGGYSHVVKAVVNLVGLFKVPVIGFSSTSPSLNKIDYFLRTVPSDTVTAHVMVEIVQKFNWNIVLVLRADTEFGHYAADSFRTSIRRKNAKICIAFDENFSRASRENEIKALVDTMCLVKRSRVVVFFGTMEDFLFFQNRTYLYFDMNNFMWITSEVWPRWELIDMRRKLTNLITITPKSSSALSRFYTYLRRRKDLNLTCLEERHVFDGGGKTGEGNNCSLAYSKFITYVFDAVYAVTKALHNMLGCKEGVSCKENLERIQHSSLLAYLRNLSFTSELTNSRIAFDSNGNPTIASYSAMKLESGQKRYKLTVIGNWTCHNGTSCSGVLEPNISTLMNSTAFQSNCGTVCGPGEYKSVMNDFPECCWECKECSGNKYTNQSGQLSCSECPSDQWPNSNHTACAKIHPEFFHLSSPSGILIFVWDVLGIMLTVAIGVVFLKYRSSHIVRASSRQLSLLLLLGITMEYALLIYMMAEPKRLQCTILYVLSHVSSCLLAATLFLKTNRIHRIFRKKAMTARPRCLGNTCQLFIIMVLVCIEIILSTLNLYLYPKTGHIKVTYVQRENEKKAFALCYFFGSSFRKGFADVLLWSYDCGMIFICTYQAYLVRKVPENYNEARYITLTMVTVSMNIIVLVITGSGMEGYNLELVYCIFQSVLATVVLGCMFFPKVYIILFQPEKNVPHEPVQSKLGTFVEDESTVKVKAEEDCFSSQSESSADSGTSSQTRGLKLLHRKVGVLDGSNNNRSGVSADILINAAPDDVGSTFREELKLETTSKVELITDNLSGNNVAEHHA